MDLTNLEQNNSHHDFNVCKNLPKDKIGIDHKLGG